jgi:adenosylcobinamide amidohydrolase
MVTPADLHPPAAGHRGVLVWRLPPGTAALSSAPVGGGDSQPAWLVNIGVDRAYRRTDLDAHVAEVAAALGLSGTGVGLLTAAEIDRVQRGACEGVVVDATVGISKPAWAADQQGGWNDLVPGTINTVVQVPVRLGPGAAVNAVITATEAKTQAMIEAGIPGTGTASDAVVVLWPTAGPEERFAGPRSACGSAIARATLAAVAAGIEATR